MNYQLKGAIHSQMFHDINDRKQTDQEVSQKFKIPFSRSGNQNCPELIAKTQEMQIKNLNTYNKENQDTNQIKPNYQKKLDYSLRQKSKKTKKKKKKINNHHKKEKSLIKMGPWSPFQSIEKGPLRNQLNQLSINQFKLNSNNTKKP